MSKHTPGPWEWMSSGHYGQQALWNPHTRDEILVPGGINDGDDPITWMGEEMTEEDAALIAAAPEILAERNALLVEKAELVWVLKEIIQFAEVTTPHELHWLVGQIKITAGDAISKAAGEKS